MDSDCHTNLRDTTIKCESSQSNSSPPISPLTCTKQTRDIARPDASIRFNAGLSRCDTECSEEAGDCTQYHPHRQKRPRGLYIDIPRSARLSPSLAWSSPTTAVHSEPAIAKWRERRGLMIITEGLLQIAVSIVILWFSATTFKSPTQPNLTEWETCDYLGTFASIWVVRMCVICGLTYWGCLYDCGLADQQHYEDLHLLTNLALTGPCNLILWVTDHTSSGVQTLSYQRFYSRLLRFLTGLSIVWWFGANILEYHSMSICRQSAPHIWGLMLGFLGISYLFIFSAITVSLVSLIWHIPKPAGRYQN